jgi:primosomal replication protein N''
MLQIHYRSNYRELIGFSNAAYYGGGLSVPVRQPEEEIRRARPIEVVRVDGEYASQTNPTEAERVADVVAGLWSRPAAECPSVGVVTFNRKQADLVEAALESRADANPDFHAILRRERDRIQNGEDMGFFVKNVENVQGDERDVIVFSTTFGRDARGTFRRNFGVLGQVGGERRLNVAVTRARNKVVLVTSIPVNEVSDWLSAGRAAGKPRDYLQAYLDYAAKVDAGAFDQVRAPVRRGS